MILTEQEIQELSDLIERSDFFDCVVPFARAVEAAIIKKIGEPVTYYYTENYCDGSGEPMFCHPDGYYPASAVPLYKLPGMSND